MTASESSPRMRLAVIAAATMSVIAGPAIAYVSVDERELGRTDPRRAAFYSGLGANFNETYRHGSALGFSIGMPKDKVLDVAAKRGFIVEPYWDGPLTETPEVETEEQRRAAALAAGVLILRTPGDNRLGVDLTVDEGRVSSISIRYDSRAL